MLAEVFVHLDFVRFIDLSFVVCNQYKRRLVSQTDIGSLEIAIPKLAKCTFHISR